MGYQPASCEIRVAYVIGEYPPGERKMARGYGRSVMLRPNYVREGAVTHGDSLGNEGRTEAGDVQVMSAGAGIRHAEYNLEQAPTRLFQIWITPSAAAGPPPWGSHPFPKADRSGRFVTLASGFGDYNDALPIRAPARVLGATMRTGETIEYAFGDLRPGNLRP